MWNAGAQSRGMKIQAGRGSGGQANISVVFRLRCLKARVSSVKGIGVWMSGNNFCTKRVAVTGFVSEVRWSLLFYFKQQTGYLPCLLFY
jgi:hypothetical protein